MTRAPARDELFVLWSAARAEANIAYDDWCADPGRDAYSSTAPPRIARTRPRSRSAAPRHAAGARLTSAGIACPLADAA